VRVALMNRRRIRGARVGLYAPPLAPLGTPVANLIWSPFATYHDGVVDTARLDLVSNISTRGAMCSAV
jgi:hypothetical protein